MFPAMKTIKTRIDGSVVYATIDNPPLNLVGAGFVITIDVGPAETQSCEALLY